MSQVDTFPTEAAMGKVHLHWCCQVKHYGEYSGMCLHHIVLTKLPVSGAWLTSISSQWSSVQPLIDLDWSGVGMYTQEINSLVAFSSCLI